MNDADAVFMDNLMRAYYHNRYQMIEPPSDIRKREFGVVRAGGRVERHMSVKDEKALYLMLLREHPLEVFASCARYTFPEQRPMDDKDWQGSDLVFDIDAKDLNPECRRRHVLSACGTCCRPAGCGCGSTMADASMPCSICIEAAKTETIRLLGVLEKDFGITGAVVHYSGNEGFHVVVEGGWPASLGRRERSDLADYMLATSLMPKTVGITEHTDCPPSVDEWGIRGRFAAAAGLAGTASVAKARELAGDPESFRAAARRASVRIDPVVTGDKTRVFRLAGSINGKSGLAKVRVRDLDAFDPYEEAVVLPDDPVTVTAHCPKFVLGGCDIGPCAGEATVPTYAAVWLICKGLAHCR